MEAEEWDARYAATDRLWSAEPNVFVAETVATLPPGRAVDLGCGEGRNAIWLARRGWQVVGVDFSTVALDRARAAARDAGVSVTWVQADLSEWQPEPGSFDLAVLAYLHLPAETMSSVLAKAREALRDGGHLLLVGHARMNLTVGVGGPQDPAVLYEPDDVIGWIGDLTVERAEHVYRDVEVDGVPRRAVDVLVFATR
ncbi:Methyltransferase type 12 [Acidothermus cellulolyticus 11B]|uniref:Methyltransferase type 12 n=1 Tax=Acidothermus cellulolyticus (strain ATCC 43068 / DSM 8971 / 11B) TaxID=351607 RepID=A0LS52_ACIC1|nr:class I SAM-dependent methyltransferase [Acidothermus cellulolyticus]ABK52262.1 Methyltransferase type 12 [Acidothermus cellulolyticus 11B]MCL6551448.1 methyltransferase domain-containing protein [Acidothermus cellulolyticus]